MNYKIAFIILIIAASGNFFIRHATTKTSAEVTTASNNKGKNSVHPSDEFVKFLRPNNSAAIAQN